MQSHAQESTTAIARWLVGWVEVDKWITVRKMLQPHYNSKKPISPAIALARRIVSLEDVQEGDNVVSRQ